MSTRVVFDPGARIVPPREPTASERIAQQDICMDDYLDRLDKKQWRDPVTGAIRPRRSARVRQDAALESAAVDAAAQPSRPPARRSAAPPAPTRPAVPALPSRHSLEPLQAFHAALLRTAALEPEAQRIIVTWIEEGVRILRGPRPDVWEAFARKDWPTVRSLIGPHERLEVWGVVFDALVQ